MGCVGQLIRQFYRARCHVCLVRACGFRVNGLDIPHGGRKVQWGQGHADCVQVDLLRGCGVVGGGVRSTLR
jgi:hypothetical protein